MRALPLLKSFKNVLFMESLFITNHQRLNHTFLKKWSTWQENNNSTLGFNKDFVTANHAVQKSSSHLTNNLVTPLSSSFVDMVVDLTRTKLSSFYLKWILPVNKIWASSLYRFSVNDKNQGDRDEGNPFNNPFDKLTKNLPPLLMDFVDPNTTPNPILSIRNIYNVFFVIKPFYDQSFSHQAVLDGAKQAFCVISDNLSRGDTSTLEGLVTPEALSVIKENLVKFTPAQLADLKVEEQDIVFWLAKEIKTIEEDNRKFVEFTVIFHVVKEYQEKLSSSEKRPFFAPDPDMTFCNYRFIREYTKDVDGEWTCNRLNHFKWGHFVKTSPFSS